MSCYTSTLPTVLDVVAAKYWLLLLMSFIILPVSMLGFEQFTKMNDSARGPMML